MEGRASEEEAMDVTPVSPAGGPPRADAPAAGAAGRFSEVLQDLDRGEKFVDRVIRRAMAGRDFTPEQLIAVQAGVYRHAQQMEAFSKLVDSVTGSVRRTLEAGG
jgi:hypothetical protein